jgi:hypothetical protein
MSTAVDNSGEFEPGEKLEVNIWTAEGKKRIPVTVVEEMFGGFYTVEDPNGQHLLMHAESDDPIRVDSKITVEDTQWVPIVNPKVSFERPEKMPEAAPEVDSTVPEFGMTSPDLAEYVAETVTALSGRILGDGKDQYEQVSSDGIVYQNFETMPIADLIRMTREEVQDQIVYLIMLDIRLQRIEAALKNKLPPEES